MEHCKKSGVVYAKRKRLRHMSSSVIRWLFEVKVGEKSGMSEGFTRRCCDDCYSQLRAYYLGHQQATV